MKNETEKSTYHYVLDLFFWLAMIYTAATCFFHGLQNWRNEDFLESGIWFLLSLSQVGQLWGWFHHKSKVFRLVVWIPLTLALFLLILSRLF
ncbi:MAG TPA: hypothetical protein PKY82_19715 [Pyrinomonadaceae bacterium]|nr:hypothetical protein [Pyrinomonadaceae bacterium]